MESILKLKEIKNINLVVFDVDGVIVPRGTKIEESKSKITIGLKFPSKEFIKLAKELLKYTNIAISSGRSMLTLKTMFAELFGEEKNGNQVILQAENGGRISIGPDEIGAGHNHNYIRNLSVLRSKLRTIKHKNIKGFEPKETFITIHCRDRVPEIEKMINKKTHYIIWNGEAYDIGAQNITKGTGLSRVKKELEKRSKKKIKTIAIGDRQNDIGLLEKVEISVSADKNLLTEADYFIDKERGVLPGITLAKHLLKLFKKNK